MTPTHITITHLGAETCVTGSCHLVRFQPNHGGGSVAILVDCGIAQGHILKTLWLLYANDTLILNQSKKSGKGAKKNDTPAYQYKRF